MKIFFTILFLAFISAPVKAVTDSSFRPSIQTAFFQLKVDEIQKSLLAGDGIADDKITVRSPDSANNPLTHFATEQIDSIQHLIEYSQVNSNQKVRYLRGLAEYLASYYKLLFQKRMGWSQLPSLINVFAQAIVPELEGESILPVILRYQYPECRLLLKNRAFETNTGLQPSKEFVFLKMLEDRPDEVMKELLRDNSYSYADSLIIVAVRRVPEDVFTGAQAKYSRLGQKIIALSTTDSLLALVVELANMRTGQMYLPFLDRINNNELTLDTVSKAISTPSLYYRLLVQTEIMYAGMQAAGNRPAAAKSLASMLKQKSAELYVTRINGLHELPPSTRFKCIQKLSPQELYYLVVMNEETIYTSSYIYVYNRIFEKLPVKSSDTLMKLVNYDRYKKFITMASNYNKLGDFLGRMNNDKATILMTDFVNNLDKGKNANDIEDAVDVANAFATISQAGIRTLMLEQVRKNFDEAATAGNGQAYNIYRIEKLIMESSDKANAINLSDSLGIPDVYDVKNRYLEDSSGRVIMQMFFYDDGSGKADFAILLRQFGDRKKWSISSTPDWIQFSSVNTKVPFLLFANRPLNGKTDQDEKAQKNLLAFLSSRGFQPSITVHRGHSFSLKYTIQKMPASSKVVVLGSCGAYQNLADILNITPDAYIISSKQVGYGEINVPIFMYLVEKLKAGGDINWPAMQKSVAGTIGIHKKEGFYDYVFPHQNLGALFIKAYKISLQQSGISFSY